MKKRTLITVLSVVLVFVLAIGAVAAVYLLQQAKVTVFNGRLGIPSASEQPANDSELIVKVDGHEVGHEGCVTAYGEDVIPVLADVSSSFDEGKCIWQDRSGNQALAAKTFVITAKSGDLSNLAYDINVAGNPSITSALRFGLVVEYNDDECGRISWIFTTSADGVQLPETLGDGNIAEGEEIRVSVAAWADAYALADLDNFDDMSFGVDFIFSAEPAA